MTRALRLALRVVGARVLPALVLLAVVGFYVAIAVEHANPPVIAVQGASMGPALPEGDLVVLQGVPPATLRTGDIVAVVVPAAVRASDGLPPDVEHRIVGIEHTTRGVRYETKGDASRRPDPFEVRPSEILGKVVLRIPLLGYPFLFFGSVPGDVVLASVVVAVAVYLLVRRERRRGALFRRLEESVGSLREDADGLRTAFGVGVGVGLPPLAAAVAEPQRSEALDRATSELQDLRAEVRISSEQSHETAAMLRDLVGAVSEYGTHLRSHTAVMRNLAVTTGQLQEATSHLVDAVRSRGATEGQPRAPDSGRATREPGAQDLRGPAIDVESWREPFTASELRWPNLARTTHGYTEGPVDRLLDRAADALDLAERERNGLRERLLVVESRLAILTEQQESIVQARLDAVRDAQEVDARVRHDATRALQEASRRVADIARDVEEEQEKVLGIARALSGQLRAVRDLPGTGARAEPSSESDPQPRQPPTVPPVWDVIPLRGLGREDLGDRLT